MNLIRCAWRVYFATRDDKMLQADYNNVGWSRNIISTLSNDINILSRIFLFRRQRRSTRVRDRADASIHCTSIIWSLHHSFNVFHVRRDVQAARGWRGCVVEPLGKLRGHELRAECYRDARAMFLPGIFSLLSPTPIHACSARIFASLDRLSSFLTLILLSAHPPTCLWSSLSIISSIRFFSLSFMRSLAQTKETESRLQTGVALIKLLKRTCI